MLSDIKHHTPLLFHVRRSTNASSTPAGRATSRWSRLCCLMAGADTEAKSKVVSGVIGMHGGYGFWSRGLGVKNNLECGVHSPSRQESS